MSNPTRPLSPVASATLQHELGELLRLAVLRGTSCHLHGRLQEVQPVVQSLREDFEQRGRKLIELRLTGLTSGELPRVLGEALGLGFAPRLKRWEAWQQLTEFLQGARAGEVPMTYLWWGLESAEETVLAACTRVMHLVEPTGAHVLLTHAVPKKGVRRLLAEFDLVELSFPKSEVSPNEERSPRTPVPSFSISAATPHGRRAVPVQ